LKQNQKKQESSRKQNTKQKDKNQKKEELFEAQLVLFSIL